MVSKYFIDNLTMDNETWYVVKERATGSALSEKFRNKSQALAKMADFINNDLAFQAEEKPELNNEEEVVAIPEERSQLSLEECDEIAVGAKRNGNNHWLGS